MMMMLDGCFILCLLLNQDDNCNDFKDLEDSQIHGKLWIWQMVKYDLLLVENQIPLFIIEKLFDLLRTPDDANVNLVSQALTLFSNLDPHRMDAPFSRPSHQVHHLLHLFYLSIVPCELSIEKSTPSSLTPNWIPSTMELQAAGVKFKEKKNALCFLDIKFSDGTMEIPPLEFHDFSIRLFRNLIAFEQCYPDTQCPITNYAVFMDCVINTPMDVRLLHRNGILRDRTGVDQGAIFFFRHLCKGIHYASDKNYLSTVYKDVTKYQGSKWHKWRAGLARDYFNNPWAAISVAAAVVLLLLTIVQTFFTVYPYFKPKN